MSARPEIALLVSTYQKPGHLVRTLASIAVQQAADRIELVVTDDGSTDETPSLVEQFARSVTFPVRLTTHRHEAFQLARCRNEGVAACTAPYLLFLDGDCILPRDHAAIHLGRRRPGIAMGGDCARLDAAASALLTPERIQSGPLHPAVAVGERWRLTKQVLKSWWYRLIRHPTKPKLVGNNIGLWRSDYERINGFDENFVGWGCEDDDFRLRLRQAGVKIRSILPWTRTYHLWHPSDSSCPRRWRDGPNVAYFARGQRETFCRNGLVKLPADEGQNRRGIALDAAVELRQGVLHFPESRLADERVEERRQHADLDSGQAVEKP